MNTEIVLSELRAVIPSERQGFEPATSTFTQS
jgi:hypothetical protein